MKELKLIRKNITANATEHFEFDVNGFEYLVVNNNEFDIYVADGGDDSVSVNVGLTFTDIDFDINTTKVGNNIVREGSPADYISKTSANDSDNNPTTKQFLIDTDIEVDSTQREDTYVVFVVAYFCAVRTVPENNADYSACTYFYDSNTEDGKGIVKTSFKINDILNKNISDIDDDGISQAMNKIEEIIMYTVMPIIWGVLGLFLVVKGALLGIQIVKAADEPQVRQEKIGSLKWLVIGVAVAYLASGAVYVVTGYFSGVFNLG